MKIVIKGKPISKARPRFVRRGKYVAVFNPQKTEEGRWLWEALQQIDGVMIEGPIAMQCEFVFDRPKSHFGTGRNSGKLKPSAPAFHVQIPDADNCLKFVKDCLNRQAYKDDCQVVHVVADKRWADPGEPARSVIYLEGVEQ